MPQQLTSNAGDGVAELVLAKTDHRWVFRYGRGQEQAALRCIAQAAGDPTQDFDWADAAILVRQMGFRFSPSIKEFP